MTAYKKLGWGGARVNPKGFTLIEVLIALTLLSIMVVLLFTSLKICADSWERGEKKITAVNEMAVVYHFFQQHLALTKPLMSPSLLDEKRFSFQGTASSLQFVSAFPASAAKPGLQLYTVESIEEEEDTVLKVTLVPYGLGVEGEELPKEEVTLIKNVTDFKLMYFGADEIYTDSVWTEDWTDKRVLPSLVKISIGLKNGIFWPDMIIALKLNTSPESTDQGGAFH